MESKYNKISEEKHHYLSTVKKLEFENKKLSLDLEEAQLKVDNYKPLYV